MTTATRRNRGVAAGLSEEAVFAAAAKVADLNGFAGLSLRAVAGELGVSPTAIYHYVAGKDDLVDAVADAFVARVLEGQLPTDPIECVRELAHRLRRAGLEHPGLLSAIVGHLPAQFPTAQIRYAEELLNALSGAGAPEESAILLYNMIVRLCLGDVVAETNLTAPARVRLPDRQQAHAQQRAFPHIARMMSHAGRYSHEEFFDLQLDVVLGALGDPPAAGVRPLR